MDAWWNGPRPDRRAFVIDLTPHRGFKDRLPEILRKWFKRNAIQLSDNLFEKLILIALGAVALWIVGLFR